MPCGPEVQITDGGVDGLTKTTSEYCQCNDVFTGCLFTLTAFHSVR